MGGSKVTEIDAGFETQPFSFSAKTVYMVFIDGFTI